MTTFLVIIILILASALAILYYLKERTEKALLAARVQADVALQERDREVSRARGEAQAAISNAQTIYEAKVGELGAESERIRVHYETYAQQAHEVANKLVAKTVAELESLRGYESLQNAEAEVRQTIVDAIAEASALRQEAQALLEQTRNSAFEERTSAQQRAREIHEQAEALLTQATRDAGRIVAEAERRAEAIGGEAYAALRDKQIIEQAARAIRNVVEGYGDRYIIPTRSLLDDLAVDLGQTAAGQAFKTAREQSRRMVEQGEAAACDYVEPNRRETAIRFVVDAFNGRVDAILSRVKHDNFGTLEQEIRDACSMVNFHGQAFRNARILPAYLDARSAELKWAVVLQELRLKEREEQRRIQEQIREEEKARREYERAMQEATRDKEAIEKAMVKARAEVEHATEQERAKLEAQLMELNERLMEAEAKNQRALSMAQQTRSGHVYIISNIGSFGEEVFKIGLTRRLEPLDRVTELGGASVPFAFDVHAMIYSEDAPALEHLLHDHFDDLRINKVNYRKEFFRLPLERLRAVAAEKGLEATFTMIAEAREYRETQALEKMTPEEREKYRVHGRAMGD
jgi:hypothetical protein